MKIFKDLFTKDEISSDAYPMTVVSDVIYEFQGKFITRSLGGDFDIGANASQESPAENESYENTSVRVINIVDSHRLQKTTFDKKQYLGYIKAYMKKLEQHLKANNSNRLESFKTNAQEFLSKKVIPDFGNFDFYIGESSDFTNGMVVLSFYKEDQVTPYFYVWKDGLEEIKY